MRRLRLQDRRARRPAFASRHSSPPRNAVTSSHGARRNPSDAQSQEQARGPRTGNGVLGPLRRLRPTRMRPSCGVCRPAPRFGTPRRLRPMWTLRFGDWVLYCRGIRPRSSPSAKERTRPSPPGVRRKRVRSMRSRYRERYRERACNMTDPTPGQLQDADQGRRLPSTALSRACSLPRPPPADIPASGTT